LMFNGPVGNLPLGSLQPYNVGEYVVVPDISLYYSRRGS
jgi:hypothetical protein